MECKKVKQVIDDLNKYDYLCKDSDYITITEWSNCEGYDIDINGTQKISLTGGMLNAINYLVQKIECDFSE